MGEWAPGSNFNETIPSGTSYHFTEGTSDDECLWRVGKKAAGRVLDEAVYTEFPKVVA